jgi:hypothetical protein
VLLSCRNFRDFVFHRHNSQFCDLPDENPSDRTLIWISIVSAPSCWAQRAKWRNAIRLDWELENNRSHETAMILEDMECSESIHTRHGWTLLRRFRHIINPSTPGPIELHIRFQAIEERREVLAGIGRVSAFHTLIISIWTKSNRDLSSNFSRRRAPTLMKFNNDWRPSMLIRAMPFRQSANGCGTFSWGGQRFTNSIEVGGLLSIIWMTILSFYCVLFHSTEFALFLKL